MKKERRGKDWDAMGNRIFLAYNEISKTINPRQLIKVDLTSSQIKVIASFFQQGTFTMAELSRLHGVSFSTMTSMVDRLLQNGLLERQRDDEDRRIVLVSLSPKGKKMVDYLMKARKQNLKKFLCELTHDEVREFVKSIEIVARHMSRSKGNMQQK
ncbi:MAG: MarR family transcriptional regulator [Proteobacteria bacterium]|nr:MarR family transcriptional regulator [Pseudomonadota bacterium]